MDNSGTLYEPLAGSTVGSARTLNHNLATLGWGALFIWWGVVVLIDPLTIGIGAIGTGLILLGVNGARWLKGIPTKGSTTALGVIALTWGALDQARIALALPSGASFALLLVGVGVITVASELLRVRKSVPFR